MSPAELVKSLSNLGIKVTDRTILNWVHAGLIPEPARANLGRGLGRESNYPINAVFRAYAVWRLRHNKGMNTKWVKKVIDQLNHAKQNEDHAYITMTEEHGALILFTRMAMAGIRADIPVRIKTIVSPRRSHLRCPIVDFTNNITHVDATISYPIAKS